jgi:hypothetical protein
MTVTASDTDTAFCPATRAEVERVRASGVLGASGRLVELYDYLVARSEENRPPKEAEIALAVFGKADAEALRDDPVARVYIHRLRKRLDEFYLRNGTPDGVRLDIPKGDYRIVCVDPLKLSAATPPAIAGPQPATVVESAAPPERRRNRWGMLAAAAAGLVIALNIAAWAIFAGQPASNPKQIAQTTVWSDLAASERPLLIVVGDYYIFGEYEDQLSLKRLIRDFEINSKEDLVNHYGGDPSGFDQYSDVALQYLPTSAAFALADLAPLFGDGRKVQVSLASELTLDRLKSDDIIFVGLLSGLGALRDPVFSRSQFMFGESYDQIIDRSSGKTYTSEAFLAAPGDNMYRDYGYFSTFKGPAGNRITILSGARDTAVMGVAESLARISSIKEIEKKTQGAADFEMLFEVKGQKHVNLETRPLASYPLDSASIWRGAAAHTSPFPAR